MNPKEKVDLITKGDKISLEKDQEKADYQKNMAGNNFLLLHSGLASGH